MKQSNKICRTMGNYNQNGINNQKREATGLSPVLVRPKLRVQKRRNFGHLVVDGARGHPNTIFNCSPSVNIHKNNSSLYHKKTLRKKSRKMCFLDNETSISEFVSHTELEKIVNFPPKENYCPFCKKTLAGPRIALVVHLAMVHTERSLFDCTRVLTSAETTRFILARKKRIDALLAIPQ